jgi:hypothetical protein
LNQEETSGVGWVEVRRLSEYSNEPYLIGIYSKIIEKARKSRGNNGKAVCVINGDNL